MIAKLPGLAPRHFDALPRLPQRTDHRHTRRRRRRERRRLAGALALWLLIPLTQAGAAPAIHRFYGYAFDAPSGKYLYTEVHQHAYEGERWINGTVRYYAADNRLIGEKTLDFSQDPYVPVFRLRLPIDHYEEAVTAIHSETIEVEKVVGGKSEREHVDRAPGLVADSGFHSFVVDHLEDLHAGRTVSFPIVVPGRLNSYRFRLTNAGEGTIDGHPVIHIRGEPDSLLRLVAPVLSLTYDLQTHYLIEYRGVSNIHDPATGKAYASVRIIYPLKPPAGAPLLLPPFDGG
jgi:hypothetical protein